MNILIKRLIYDWVPPAVINFAYLILDVIRPASYEFIDYSWPQEMHLKGWQADGVQENREQTWQTFVNSVEGNGLLGIGENDLNIPQYINLNVQNLYLSYGYCLSLACHNKQRVTMLDWGGSIGHYYLIGKNKR